MSRLRRAALCARAHSTSSRTYDALVVGGGHNGLVSAAYLAKAGLSVCVLESRHLLGGAAVTEELFPGFKYSRASYLAGLLRPAIIRELELERHGFRYLVRDPSSFTPTLDGRSLLLGSDEAANARSLSQFSARDAEALPRYEAFLARVRDVVQPLLDGPPPDVTEGGWRERLGAAQRSLAAASALFRAPGTAGPLAELFTAPASHILDRWFESDVLKATLATDSVIGALVSPHTPGSGYVLLHHVMGSAAGRDGVWAYVKGGMGGLSGSIAAAAAEAGAELRTGCEVAELLVGADGSAGGVRLKGGETIRAKKVLATVTPFRLFKELLPPAAAAALPPAFSAHIGSADYSCGAFKINLALSRLPQYTCMPPNHGRPQPCHMGTAHFESSIVEIHSAYLDAQAGRPSTTPVVELTIPSALDDSISPPGKHVAGLFVQYAPYTLSGGRSWDDPAVKAAFAASAYAVIEKHAPGFTASILHADVLSPLDLERVFGLKGGNIFHGAISLHQLAHNRPAPGWASHRTPLAGLYLAGSGAHPGGGVSGAPGRNAAKVVLHDMGKAAWW